MKRTIGIVVDVGAEQTVVAPVYEGMVLTHTIRTSRVGGESLTRFMAELLLESQPEKHSHLLRRRQLHIARQVKEQAACVAPDYFDAGSWDTDNVRLGAAYESLGKARLDKHGRYVRLYWRLQSTRLIFVSRIA
jgi:hypothetical protein